MTAQGFKVGDQQRLTSYLVCRFGGGPEKVVIWDTVDITVGRLKSQDIVVRDSEVSREHAVFRKKEGEYSVEDLATGLGTLVNGERVKVHTLQPGDLVEIGALALKFGQTQRVIRPGASVRYASQLKGLGPPAAPEGAGGRTMLAIDPEEDLTPAATPPPAPGPAKAVSADGTLEDLPSLDPLGSEDADDYLGEAPQVRDLDRELADEAMRPTHAIVRLEIELEGPMPQLQAVLNAVLDKSIEVPPIAIRIRQPGRG